MIYRASRTIEKYIILIGIIILSVLLLTDVKNHFTPSFFVPFIIIAVVYLIYVNRKTKLILDNEGITSIGSSVIYTYKWDQIYDIEIIEDCGNKYIGFNIINYPKWKRHSEINKDQAIDDSYQTTIEEIYIEIEKHITRNWS